MISQRLDPWESFDFKGFFQQVNERDIQIALSKDTLGEQDILALLSPAAEGYLEEMAQRAQRLTLQHFGRALQLYTPLYLSNHCKNHCIYCGFRKGESMERRHLNPQEIRKEAESIVEMGIKHILILTGGDREKSPPQYILEAVEILTEYFSSISIEIYSLEEQEYKDLVDAGVNHLTLYQETYHQEKYRKYHPKGEKSDFLFRLNAPDRAARAGVHSVNLGVLLGLDLPERDFFKAILHSRHLQKEHPSLHLAMSFPRIRPAVSGFQAPYPMDDKTLVKLMLVYRLAFPRGDVSISTRESAALRDRLIPLGATKMSVASRTSVGSRSVKEDGKEQFPVFDKRGVEEMKQDLLQAGYQAVFKDWDIL